MEIRLKLPRDGNPKTSVSKWLQRVSKIRFSLIDNMQLLLRTKDREMYVYQEPALDKSRGLEKTTVYQEPALDNTRRPESMHVYQELPLDKNGESSVIKSWLLIIAEESRK